jgi:hypothetical protein
MAQVEVADGRLVIRLDRADRLWAFDSELEVPLDHVSGVEVDSEKARIPWSGLPVRDAGSWAPGMLAAGTVRQVGKWAFWDVRDPQGAIIIHLADERFARLVVEVIALLRPTAWSSASSPMATSLPLAGVACPERRRAVVRSLRGREAVRTGPPQRRLRSRVRSGLRTAGRSP